MGMDDDAVRKLIEDESEHDAMISRATQAAKESRPVTQAEWKMLTTALLALAQDMERLAVDVSSDDALLASLNSIILGLKVLSQR